MADDEVKDEMEEETVVAPSEEVAELEEVEKEEDSKPSKIPKISSKLIIGLLSGIIFVALIAFFKGGDTPPPAKESPSIQTPPADSSAFPENDFPLESDDPFLADEAPLENTENPPDEVDASGSNEEMAFDPFSEEVEHPPSESEALALVKSAQEKPARAKTPPAKPKAKKSIPKKPKSASFSGLFTIQVGAFSEQKTADQFAGKLDRSGYDAYVLAQGDGLFRVRVGKFKSRAEAEKVALQLKKTNQVKTFVTRN